MRGIDRFMSLVFVCIVFGLLVLFVVLRPSYDIKYKKLEAAKEPVNLPAELKSELLVMLKSGQKIDAIKHYRGKTGVGLAVAKDFVELLQKDISK